MEFEDPFFEVYNSQVHNYGNEYIAFFNSERNSVVYLHEPSAVKREIPRRFCTMLEEDDMLEYVSTIASIDFDSVTSSGAKATSPATWIRRSLEGEVDYGTVKTGYQGAPVDTLIRDVKREILF